MTIDNLVVVTPVPHSTKKSRIAATPGIDLQNPPRMVPTGQAIALETHLTVTSLVLTAPLNPVISAFPHQTLKDSPDDRTRPVIE